MKVVAAALILMTVTPCLAVYETDGVRLRGFAYTPFSNTGAVRITFRLQNVYGDASISTSGIFDCRAQPSLGGACPSSSPGAAVAELGYSDVKGDVSSARLVVTFPDGTTCDFDGLTPLPLNGGPKFLNIRTPLVSVAGTYTCHDASAATIAQGNFYTIGSRLAIPKCTGGNHVLCSPI